MKHRYILTMILGILGLVGIGYYLAKSEELIGS